MVSTIHDNGFVCRFGGEEFMIYYESSQFNIAKDFVNKVKEQFTKYYQLHHQITITFSAGIAIYHKENSLTELFNIADAYLYESKRNGKNQVTGH